MNDVVKGLKKVAKLMAADRPDIWTKKTAYKDAVRWYNDLMANDTQYVGMAGWLALKFEYEDDRATEIEFVRHAVSFSLDNETGEMTVFNWKMHLTEA